METHEIRPARAGGSLDSVPRLPQDVRVWWTGLLEGLLDTHFFKVESSSDPRLF